MLWLFTTCSVFIKNVRPFKIRYFKSLRAEIKKKYQESLWKERFLVEKVHTWPKYEQILWIFVQMKKKVLGKKIETEKTEFNKVVVNMLSKSLV